MDKQESKETDWKWRYSFLTGVMYGPIPVGIIVVVIVFFCFWWFRLIRYF